MSGNKNTETPDRTADVFNSKAFLTLNSGHTAGGLPLQPHVKKDIFYFTEDGNRTVGNKTYELTDHLGSVRVTFSDKRLAIVTGSTITDFNLDVTSWQDMYSFGMLMPGRFWPGNTVPAGGYRFGFNGKEKDDEVKGITGSSYDYGFRIYDSRLGRFLSVDPITKNYPWYTPYQFAGNKPIMAIDLDGLEEITSNFILNKKTGEPTFKIHTSKDFDEKGNPFPLDFKFTLNNRSITQKGIAELSGSEAPHELIQAGLDKIRNDYEKYGDQFPKTYYIDFTKHLINKAIELNKGDIKAGLTDAYETVDTDKWKHGSALFHAYENYVKDNDKVQHFAASAYWQYVSKGTLSEVLQYGKETRDAIKKALFNEGSGWDEGDIKANREGEKFGKELEESRKKKEELKRKVQSDRQRKQ